MFAGLNCLRRKTAHFDKFCDTLNVRTVVSYIWGVFLCTWSCGCLFKTAETNGLVWVLFSRSGGQYPYKSLSEEEKLELFTFATLSLSMA